MPELPEVETARRIVDDFITGHEITSVWTQPDTIIYANASHEVVRQMLYQSQVIKTARKGKHMWLELDSGNQVAFHLGMTGSFEARNDDQDRLRFTKLEIQREDGRWLAFLNKRRLGRIRLHTDILKESPIEKLGWDPMTNPASPAAFYQSLQKRRTPIKALLLNQQFVAGIGNWIADEILFQSATHPEIHANQLSRKESDLILKKMIQIIRFAIKVKADDSHFPKNWLFHHRWGQNKHAKTSEGDPLEFIQVGGRTTAFVPARQGQRPGG